MKITLEADRRRSRSISRERRLVVIDMQRDFVEPGGFGEALGNDVSRLAAAVAPVPDMLDAARSAGMLVVHTREGHRPDLRTARRAKRSAASRRMRIGDAGSDGPHADRGEPGDEIVPELVPRPARS